jgi:hypothetical protein
MEVKVLHHEIEHRYKLQAEEQETVHVTVVNGRATIEPPFKHYNQDKVRRFMFSNSDPGRVKRIALLLIRAAELAELKDG